VVKQAKENPDEIKPGTLVTYRVEHGDTADGIAQKLAKEGQYDTVSKDASAQEEGDILPEGALIFIEQPAVNMQQKAVAAEVTPFPIVEQQ